MNSDVNVKRIQLAETEARIWRMQTTFLEFRKRLEATEITIYGQKRGY